MRCFIDPDNNPFTGVPLPMRGRRADELNREGIEAFGVQLDGGDAMSVSCELSGCPSPVGFLRWCEYAGIIRCDCDRPSDLTFFLGRSPMTLGAIDAFVSQPDVRAALTSLAPDEVYTQLHGL